MKSHSDFALLPILEDIQRAIDARLYYLAIAVSLAIPDIAAACETEPPWATPAKYKNWCDRYLIKRFKYMTADDCYRIRCGALHAGIFGQNHNVYHRIIFTIPQPGISIGENLIMESGRPPQNALTFDTRNFCNDVAEATNDWYAEKKCDPIVQSNLARVVRYREDGAPPFLVGYPAIA